MARGARALPPAKTGITINMVAPLTRRASPPGPAGSDSLRSRDTALAWVFLALLLRYLTPLPHLAELAMGMCLLALMVPGAYHYPAKAWFGLSQRLGSVMSKGVLALLYYLLLTPLALIKGLVSGGVLTRGRDAETMMITRNHTFGSDGWDELF